MKMNFLEGIRVLELANVLAGPGVGAALAELGADVVKVENLRTKGDVTRTWKLPDEDPDTDISGYFSSVNWGKKSVSLDLLAPEGLEIIHQAARSFDIVLASYKPGDAEKLKVDYATLSRFNPKLIYAHLTGYGLQNDRAGYDAIIQAETGFTFMNGEPDCRPVKMPVALMDVLAGHHMKEAILLSLYNRERTGKGQYIDVSLFRSGITSLANQATNWLVGNCIPKAMGSDHPNIVPYGTIYYTSDNKPIVLAVGSDKQFTDLMAVLGEPEIAGDPKYRTNLLRVQNRNELQNMLIQLIARFERDRLLADLDHKKVPAGGVFNMQEVFDQPEARELMISGTTAYGRNIKGVKSLAFNMNQPTFAGDLNPPPAYGEHTTEVLKTYLSYPDELIESLIQKKVIYDRNY
jgi:crotonobetainyl-CoA:carnitine CoA-transferase CaiB-like acyl-CoA transferase